MLDCFVFDVALDDLIPIRPIIKGDYETWLEDQEAFVAAWAKNSGFEAEPNTMRLVPDASGKLSQVLIGVNDMQDFWQMGGLPAALPEGQYYLDVQGDMYHDRDVLFRALLAFGLGAYQFDKYVERKPYPAKLFVPNFLDSEALRTMTESIYLVRDLINTPTEDMGPPELTAAVEKVADRFNAKVKVIVGDKLLKENYPMIHAVGRAGSRPPALIDLTWGDKDAPKLTLVGKGVCFDTGGLDIKPAAGMREMKKDMAGAAHVLGLAQIIMASHLPVRLRVLISAAENAVDAVSYRPGDVIKSRAGVTVEIHNTDAEGRLVMCDALTEAVSEKPDCLINFATLTGAARVALGLELPALFCNSDDMAKGLIDAGKTVQEPLWQLPLYAPYKELLQSDIADMTNCAKIGYGGAITAGLFLQRFVPDDINWAHFDVMASNPSVKPGRPIGGEAQGLRAVWRYLQTRFH